MSFAEARRTDSGGWVLGEGATGHSPPARVSRISGLVFAIVSAIVAAR